jgi:hypothetical protein
VFEEPPMNAVNPSATERLLPLAVGDRAFAILATKPTKSGRRTLIDVARVRIEQIDGDVFVVRTLKTAGVALLDRRYVAFRCDLFSARSREERDVFAARMRLFFEGSWRGESRR